MSTHKLFICTKCINKNQSHLKIDKNIHHLSPSKIEGFWQMDHWNVQNLCTDCVLQNRDALESKQSFDLTKHA